MLNSASVMRLTLVRHAVTSWNTAGRVQGQSDVPLSSLGEAQAGALRERFAGDELLLYSSPLNRARTTAALAFPGHAPTLDARLSELNFGRFEGLTLSERLALPEWRKWTHEPFSVPAPSGESYGELYWRASAWLEALPDAPHIVAVTHSGTIQTLVAYLLQMNTQSWRKRMHLEHTSVTEFVSSGSELVLERLNDTAHLSAELQTVPAASPAASQAASVRVAESPEEVQLDP